MTIDSNTIIAKIRACTKITECEKLFASYLWPDGELAKAMQWLKSLSPEEKKTQWPVIKAIKDQIETAYNQHLRDLQYVEINKKLVQDDPIDFSLELPASYEWHRNLLARERRRVETIAHNMGFRVEYGHDIVSKYENFYSVNIPADHPATEMHDTIYLYDTDEKGEHLVMRTHTSAHQVMYMKKYATPLFLMCIGKVYRYEKMDASHDTAFRQIEGMVIDKGISTAHCKGFLEDFLSALFEEKKEIRLRPWYFPFVEPGYEIDVKYNIGNKTGDDNRLELLGAGMIHPNVLKEGGIDPNEYSGFAFWIGLTRLVAVKYGIKDIRLLTNGDVRFVKSF